jgi:predicted HTH transcriptional regulator
MERKRPSIVKRVMKFMFYGVAAIVGVLLAISAMRKRGDIIKEKGKKLFKKAKKNIRTTTGGLSRRQKKMLKLFDREDQITNDMISSVIRGISERTIRRDLTELEEKGYIKKVGKTKGSYYVLA